MWYALISSESGNLEFIVCFSDPGMNFETQEEREIVHRLIRSVLYVRKLTEAQALSFEEMNLAPIIDILDVPKVLKENYPDDWEQERKYVSRYAKDQDHGIAIVRRH